MAKLFDLDEKAWKAWLDERPEVVRKIGEKLLPNLLYRMKSTGQRVTLEAISENGTVRVLITGEFNFIDFDREVFGIDPDDLEECDLPTEGEYLGTLCRTEGEVQAIVAIDLIELHHAGKPHNREICPICKGLN